MPSHELAAEIRSFVLSYGEHDTDCPEVDARAWHAQRPVCVCGFSPRLNELMRRLEAALSGTAGGAELCLSQSAAPALSGGYETRWARPEAR